MELLLQQYTGNEDRSAVIPGFNDSACNVKVLEPQHIQPYLHALQTRMHQLGNILSLEGDEFVQPFIKQVTDSIDCLVLKHQLTGADKIDFPCTIDPTSSGFPTFKDFYLLQKDKKEARERLEILGSKEKIIDEARDVVLRGGSPTTAQIKYRRHQYYSALENVPALLEDFQLGSFKLTDTVISRHDPTQRYYTLDWSCIESGSNLPVIYRMNFTQDNSQPKLTSEVPHDLQNILYGTKYGMQSIRQLAMRIDQEILHLHPKMIEKYTIGPYHNSVTENNPELDAVLEGIEEKNVLRFRRETTMSETSKHIRGFMAELGFQLFGIKNQTEIFSEVYTHDYRMIVPFRLKQKLHDSDECGKPCKVYATAKDGMIS